jgi:hypothetical protein
MNVKIIISSSIRQRVQHQEQQQQYGEQQEHQEQQQKHQKLQQEQHTVQDSDKSSIENSISRGQRSMPPSYQDIATHVGHHFARLGWRAISSLNGCILH